MAVNTGIALRHRMAAPTPFRKMLRTACTSAHIVLDLNLRYSYILRTLRNITATLLVLLLVLMTGLGDAAHALSTDCANVHCDDHMIVTDHYVEQGSGEATNSVSRGSNGTEQDECNPFLCNALVLTLGSSETVFDKSEATLAWQVSSLSTLEEPVNPDRPPNL